jgi:large subunit ribosomal protein L28
MEVNVARVCDICGRGPKMGNQITRSGLAKSKGGIGLHTGGISRRKFAVNLHPIKAMVGKTVKRMRVCSRCLKAGKVKKAGPRVIPAAMAS